MIAEFVIFNPTPILPTGAQPIPEPGAPKSWGAIHEPPVQVENIVPRQRRSPSVHVTAGTDVLVETSTDDAVELLTREVENVEGTRVLEMLETICGERDAEDSTKVECSADGMGVELVIVLLRVVGT